MRIYENKNKNRKIKRKKNRKKNRKISNNQLFKTKHLIQREKYV